MSCESLNGCNVLNVTSATAKLFITVETRGCACVNMCRCSTGFNSDTTSIYIRRDGPKYSPSFGCCGNPAHRVNNCPILPGQLSYPYPTYIVPCPDPIAPPFNCDPGSYWYYKFPPFVQYKLFSRNGNELCFFLDSIFYDAPAGRYVADLFVNDVYTGSQRLKYSTGYRISSARTQQFNRQPCADNMPSPSCNTGCD